MSDHGSIDREAQARVIPVPDPSDRTISLVEGKVHDLKTLLESRMDASDRATVLLAESVNRIPTVLDREVARLTQNIELSLKGINDRFNETDKRFDAVIVSLKEAAQAQHNADTTAIGKSEAGMARQVSALEALISAMRESWTTQMTAMASRLDKGEAATTGVRENRTEARQSIVAMTAIGGLVFAIISGLVGFNLSHFVLATPAAVGPYVPPPGFELKPQSTPAPK